MHVAVATIVGGRASVNTGGGAGGGRAGRASFCRLIWADREHHPWPGVLSNLSSKGFGDIFSIGNKQPIAIDGGDVVVDLLREM
jgi:hypothetical protein